jgi:hypothetical protein
VVFDFVHLAGKKKLLGFLFFWVMRCDGSTELVIVAIDYDGSREKEMVGD